MAKTVEKKDASEITSKSNQLTLRCGDCLHFAGTAHPSFGQACKLMGVKTFATAPNCYSPNVILFRKAGPDTFATLASVIASFSPQQSRVLMGLLKSAGSLEKHGYTFLQKVYFRCGEDFLDNYFYGHVLGLGLNGTLAVVGASYFTATRSPLVAYLLPESVFSAEVFNKKKRKLQKYGLLYAPRKPHVNDITADYEPPTMETSPEILEKIANQTFGKKKRKPQRVIEDGVFRVNLEYETPVAVGRTSTKNNRIQKEDELDD